MGRKQKYSAKQKIWAAETYLKGLKSAAEIAVFLNMGPNGARTIRLWSRQYRIGGAELFRNKPHNNSYSLAFKKKICQEYLAGKGSYEELTACYGISSRSVVSEWVKKYTGIKTS